MYRIHKEELCDLLRSPSNVKRVNFKKLQWAWDVARIEKGMHTKCS